MSNLCSNLETLKPVLLAAIFLRKKKKSHKEITCLLLRSNTLHLKPSFETGTRHNQPAGSLRLRLVSVHNRPSSLLAQCQMQSLSLTLLFGHYYWRTDISEQRKSVYIQASSSPVKPQSCHFQPCPTHTAEMQG